VAKVELNKTNRPAVEPNAEKLTKKNRGGKRKGAGRPKLGRDKLLTVRLSTTTIDEIGPHPARTVRRIIEMIYDGGYDVSFRYRKSELDKALELQDLLAGDH
jgi:hypothetical protein